jgi:hypothetical protein
MIPINIQSYSFDLVAANAPGSSPAWTMLHDYVSYYGLSDMRPDNIYSIAVNIQSSESAATQYLWDRTRRVGP